MSQDDRHNTINYIEFPLADVEATKAFYSLLFGWRFQDWGPSYLSFSGAAVEGGFNGEAAAAPTGSGVLVVLYSKDIEATRGAVARFGAHVSKEIFAFPGGRRFHVIDPNGSEIAIWSE